MTSAHNRSLPRERTLKVVTAGDRTPTLRNRNVNEHSLALAREWKRLGRAATAVAVLTSPILYVMLLSAFDWAWYWAAAGRLRDRRDLPRAGRRDRPQADPGADDLRRRERAQARRHHLPAAPLVLAQEVPPPFIFALAVAVAIAMVYNGISTGTARTTAALDVLKATPHRLRRRSPSATCRSW